MKTKQVHEIHLNIGSTTVHALVYRCDLYKDNYPQRLTSKVYNVTMASFMRCAEIGRLITQLTQSRSALLPNIGDYHDGSRTS